MSYKPFQVQMMLGATRRRRGWLGRNWRPIVIVVGVAFLFATLSIAISGLRDDPAACDAALVLGTRVELDGTPSFAMARRLDRAVEAFKAGMVPVIIASGGKGSEGFDESAVMRDYLIKQGVPADKVIADPLGNTTFDSARNTREIAGKQGFKSILVVSQYYHLPRARLALRGFGFTTVHTAHPALFSFRDLWSCPRETFGYMSYLVRSYK